MIGVHSPGSRGGHLFGVPRPGATSECDSLKANVNTQLVHNNAGQLLNQIHAAISFRAGSGLNSHASLREDFALKQ